MQQSQRIGWIEWARALGALGVVLLHVCTSSILGSDLEVDRMWWYTSAGIVFGRWAVPAFFMITGMLLLDPEREVGRERIRAYVKRMVGVLATFGFAFALMEEGWTCIQEGARPTLAIVPAAVVDVLTASTWDHLWYVYALVFVYLLAPAIRALYLRVGEHRFTVFSLILAGVALGVPTIARMVMAFGGQDVVVEQHGLVALAQNVAIGLTCFCVGGCLRSWRLTALTGTVGIASLACMLALSSWGYVARDEDLGFVFLQGSWFACAYAVGVLLVLRHVVGEKPISADSPMGALARDSFGIYVLHPVFVHVVLIAVDPLNYPAGLFEVGFFVVVVVASVVATRLIRHIPYVGTLL